MSQNLWTEMVMELSPRINENDAELLYHRAATAWGNDQKLEVPNGAGEWADLTKLFEQYRMIQILKGKMMATAKTVTKLSDKITKVNENFSINMYDNGFMVEVGGRNKKGDYTNAKILCSTLEEVQALVAEACVMERDT